MKTTIEIPDALFTKAKATAALRGETLKEFITAALEAKLASTRMASTERGGWRRVFGLAEPAAVQRVDRIIAEDLEQVDPSEWR